MAQIDITAKLLGEDKLRSTLQRMSAHDIPKAIKAGVRYAAKRLLKKREKAGLLAAS